jgi:hypothetical protein
MIRLAIDFYTNGPEDWEKGKQYRQSIHDTWPGPESWEKVKPYV